MGLALDHLDDETRRAMRSEIDSDIANGTLYLSDRLSARGVTDYPGLLIAAADGADDDWLAMQLAQAGRIVALETSSRRGRLYTKRVPSDAPLTLAEGEFNRFYLRGLCLVAMAAGEDSLEIYRAKRVMQSRSLSRRLLGRLIAVGPLLEDLRTHPGVNTALGLPAGPNSGLSARRVPT